MDVLVVDDSRAHRTATKHLLAGVGLKVTEASDGTEGLHHLKRGTKFGLVLVDLEMPGMSGLDFIRKVREQPAHEKTPILLMGPATSEGPLVEALAAGANEYLMKPFGKDALAAKLDILGIDYS
jgi:two-component system chemotaxis response regulator CheY